MTEDETPIEPSPVIDLAQVRNDRLRETFDELVSSHGFTIAFAKWLKLHASDLKANDVSTNYTTELERDDGKYRIKLTLNVGIVECTLSS